MSRFDGYTKGPWNHFTRDGDNYLESADGKLSLCDAHYYPWIRANHRDWELMSAAPELLSALEEAREVIANLLAGHRSHRQWEVVGRDKYGHPVNVMGLACAKADDFLPSISALLDGK